MSDPRSIITDARSLMGCCAVLVGEYFPTFRKSLCYHSRMYLKLKVLKFFETSGNSRPVTQRNIHDGQNFRAFCWPAGININFAYRGKCYKMPSEKLAGLLWVSGVCDTWESGWPNYSWVFTSFLKLYKMHLDSAIHHSIQFGYTP